MLIRRFFLAAPCVLWFCLGAAAPSVAAQPTVRLLSRANVLPLSIDPAFEIRKTKLYFLESELVANGRQGGGGGGGNANTNSKLKSGGGDEASIAFERKRLLYGAVTSTDIRDRYGNYFTFFWRAARRANLTVRLEYRQQKLAAFVQAREVDYPDVVGSRHTEFRIIGDDYFQQGRVTAWRVLLIENHQTIVGLAQSYLWQ